MRAETHWFPTCSLFNSVKQCPVRSIFGLMCIPFFIKLAAIPVAGPGPAWPVFHTLFWGPARGLPGLCRALVFDESWIYCAVQPWQTYLLYQLVQCLFITDFRFQTLVCQNGKSFHGKCQFVLAIMFLEQLHTFHQKTGKILTYHAMRNLMSIVLAFWYGNCSVRIIHISVLLLIIYIFVARA